MFFTTSGVKKGDRVAIYMPMINELVVAMLACARIGAVHSIVVSQFKLLHVNIIITYILSFLPSICILVHPPQ